MQKQGPVVVNAGDPVSYTILIANGGPDTAGDVELSRESVSEIRSRFAGEASWLKL